MGIAFAPQICGIASCTDRPCWPIMTSPQACIATQSSKRCPLLLPVWLPSNTGNYPLKIQTIFKEMRSSGTTYTVFSLPSMVATIIQGMLSSTARAFVRLLDKIHESIHGMWFSGTAGAVHTLPSTVTILGVVGLFVISCRYHYGDDTTPINAHMLLDDWFGTILSSYRRSRYL